MEKQDVAKTEKNETPRLIKKPESAYRIIDYFVVPSYVENLSYFYLRKHEKTKLVDLLDKTDSEMKKKSICRDLSALEEEIADYKQTDDTITKRRDMFDINTREYAYMDDLYGVIKKEARDLCRHNIRYYKERKRLEKILDSLDNKNYIDDKFEKDMSKTFSTFIRYVRRLGIPFTATTVSSIAALGLGLSPGEVLTAISIAAGTSVVGNEIVWRLVIDKINEKMRRKDRLVHLQELTQLEEWHKKIKKDTLNRAFNSAMVLYHTKFEGYEPQPVQKLEKRYKIVKKSAASNVEKDAETIKKVKEAYENECATVVDLSPLTIYHREQEDLDNLKDKHQKQNDELFNELGGNVDQTDFD